MLAVADVIEHFDRVDLDSYAAPRDGRWKRVKPAQLWEDCGTVGCIAGWTCAWADVNKTGRDDGFYNAAKRELGLTDREADRLFMGYDGFWYDNLGEDSAKWNAQKVAGLLRKIAGGKVFL